MANEALVASPDMNDWLDGFALQFVVHALRGGRAQVTVDGMVNLLDGPPRLEPLLDPYTPSYEKVRAQRLPLHETRNFALVEGSALVRFGGNPLALELSIRMAQAPAARERTFDLGGLAAPRGASPATLDLCPPQAFVLEHEEEESSTEPMLDLEAARGLVERIVASGVAREDEPDAEVEALGRQLVVSAPEPVLGKVGSLLGLLETACLGEERLEVRVLSGEAPFDLPTLLDAEESDRRVAELVASGKGRVVRVGSSALADGVAAAIRSPVAETHVYDWEVEIAHGAVIFDPSVRIHETGLAVCARAARAPDATSIDVALRWFEPDDRFRERVARPTVWYSSPLPPRPDPDDPDPEDARGPSVFQAEIPLRIEYANARMVGCASSFVLANGQALWIPCRVETTAGPISCALEVRVRGPWRPMEQVLVAGSAGAPEAAVVHVGRWRSSGFGAGPMDDSTIANDSAGERDFDPWWPSIVSAQSVGVDLPDLAERTLAELGDGGGETFVVPLSDHDLYVQAPAAMRAEIVRRFERASPAGRPLELHGRVTRGAATIGEFRLPATTGKLATIWSGLDGCFLADWDVDVAGESMAGNPEVGLFLDGFALRFNARTSGDQQVQLAVSGVVNHLEGAPEIEEIRNPYTPFHEQLKSRRLFIDETRNLPCADGIAVARFGGDALALEVTVRLR